ncbi:hypothetical protein J6590_024934 [Homalodisca vitripennis]|nr:hypothetical protein J6590_024934 [Homalodisca vitripennis]
MKQPTVVTGLFWYYSTSLYLAMWRVVVLAGRIKGRAMLLIVGLDNRLQQPTCCHRLISGTTVRPLPGYVAVVVLYVPYLAVWRWWCYSVNCNSGAMLLIVGLDNSLQQPTCCHRLISGTTVRPLPGCVTVVVLFTARQPGRLAVVTGLSLVLQYVPSPGCVTVVGVISQLTTIWGYKHTAGLDNSYAASRPVVSRLLF